MEVTPRTDWHCVDGGLSSFYKFIQLHKYVNIKIHTLSIYGFIF